MAHHSIDHTIAAGLDSNSPFIPLLEKIPKGQMQYVTNNPSGYLALKTSSHSNEKSKPEFGRYDFSIAAIKLLIYYGYILDYNHEGITLLKDYGDLFQRILAYESSNVEKVEVGSGLEYFQGLKDIIETFNYMDELSLPNRLRNPDTEDKILQISFQIPERKVSYVRDNLGTYNGFEKSSFSWIQGNEQQQGPDFPRYHFSKAAIKLLSLYGYISKFDDNNIEYLSSYESLFKKVLSYEIQNRFRSYEDNGSIYVMGLENVIKDFNANNTTSLQNRLVNQDSSRITQEAQVVNKDKSKAEVEKIWESLGNIFQDTVINLNKALGTNNRDEIITNIKSIISHIQSLKLDTLKIEMFLNGLYSLCHDFLKKSNVINNILFKTIELIKISYGNPSILNSEIKYSEGLVTYILEALKKDMVVKDQIMIAFKSPIYVAIINTYFEQICGLNLTSSQKSYIEDAVKDSFTIENKKIA